MSCFVATVYSLGLLVMLVAAIIQSHCLDSEEENKDQ